MLPADWQKRFNGRWERGFALAPLTTWRIGGPAELYIEPATVESLAWTLDALRRIGMPYRILGGGSNLLVGDSGVRGAVVALSRLRSIERAGGAGLFVEAGARLSAVVRAAGAWGLAGTEPLAGIPGSVGGAIYGNAGGRHGDIGSLVKSLDLLEPDGGIRRVTPEDGFFGYHSSRVGDRIVLGATLGLEPADPHEVRGRALGIIRDRRGTQPGWVGNAGCVFKNPPGESAGRLIDSADCNTMREGAVHVSRIHANFIENDGGARAEDVLRLTERVRERVRRVYGVDLEWEVRRWL